MLLFCLTLIAEAQTEQDLAQGFELLNKENPKEALYFFFKAETSTEESFAPLKPYSLFGLAQAYYQNKEYDSAAFEFADFIQKYKELEKAHSFNMDKFIRKTRLPQITHI